MDSLYTFIYFYFHAYNMSILKNFVTNLIGQEIRFDSITLFQAQKMRDNF